MYCNKSDKARKAPNCYNRHMKVYKKEQGTSYAIGVYPTLELLTHQLQHVERILIHPKGNQNKGVREIEKICKEHHISIDLAEKSIYNISQSENCYAIGVFKKYKTAPQKGNHLVLVNPSDKGNVGSITRTMLAFGVRNLIIISPGIDLFDPKVIRASMGAIFSLSYMYYASFEEYMKNTKNTMYPFMTSAKTDITQLQIENPHSLIFGNEGEGLTKDFETIGTPVKIPQQNEVDSLNLSIAVGIGIFVTSLQTTLDK